MVLVGPILRHRGEANQVNRIVRGILSQGHADYTVCVRFTGTVWDFQALSVPSSNSVAHHWMMQSQHGEVRDSFYQLRRLLGDPKPAYAFLCVLEHLYLTAVETTPTMTNMSCICTNLRVVYWKV